MINLLVMIPFGKVSIIHLNGECRQRMDALIICILHWNRFFYWEEDCNFPIIIKYYDQKANSISHQDALWAVTNYLNRWMFWIGHYVKSHGRFFCSAAPISTRRPQDTVRGFNTFNLDILKNMRHNYSLSWRGKL